MLYNKLAFPKFLNKVNPALGLKCLAIRKLWFTPSVGS